MRTVWGYRCELCHIDTAITTDDTFELIWLRQHYTLIQLVQAAHGVTVSLTPPIFALIAFLSCHDHHPIVMLNSRGDVRSFPDDKERADEC